jgi:diguanylate cyclase (GGDEF)-like protein
MKSRWLLPWVLGLGALLAGCEDESPVDIEAVAGAPGSAEAVRDDRIVLPGSGEAVKVRLRLPATEANGSTQLWLARDMVESVHLEHGRWRGPAKHFFTPPADVPLWPAGFSLPLPEGDARDVVLVARSSTPATLQPRLASSADIARQQQRLVGLASALYAALAVLSLVALSLYIAVRDRAYLALLAFTAGALAWLMAANGHLYTTPGLRMAGALGAQGAWALLFLLSAATIWVGQRYAELWEHALRLHRGGSRALIVLLVLAAACLVNLDALAVPMRWLACAGATGAAVFALAAAVVAVRQQLWNSVGVLVLMLLTAVAALARELVAHGIAPDTFWTRYGYQMGLLACAFALTITLIARLARVRAERDSERVARDESERRLQREATRVSLSQQLQERLRDLPPGDMEWAAFRLLFSRLQPLLRLDASALVAYGYHGMDLLLTEPIASKAHFSELVASRQSILRGISRGRHPTKLPLGDPASRDPPDALHAVVPLPIRAPGWGVLLLRRGNGHDFSSDELALASDFALLAMQQADDALTAANLRRSAELDALTGTLNRRTIDLWLARSFSEAHRAHQSLSVLFVDLDHFKSINDTHGHASGDACLRHVAAILRQQLDSGDMLGRYGGEEFVLVLPGRDGDAARRLGERLREAIERSRFDCNGTEVSLTVSIGVAPRLPDEAQPAAAVERADKALYSAKRSGRNRVCVAPAVFS